MRGWFYLCAESARGRVGLHTDAPLACIEGHSGGACGRWLCRVRLAAQGAESLDEWCLKAMGAMHVHPSVTALPECVTHCTALHCTASIAQLSIATIVSRESIPSSIHTTHWRGLRGSLTRPARTISYTHRL